MIPLQTDSEKAVLLRSRDGNYLKLEESQPFSGNFYYDSACIDVDSASASHKILGFGASLTDSSCYLISRLAPEKRTQLLDDLFSEDKLALSIARLNVGASDYATCAYSYDEGDEDLELKNFSIAHDHKWIIPTVKSVLGLRPDLFIYSSPWSPPGWMKTTHSMCGGDMRAKYLPAYADYLVKYLLAYRECGIDIQALTMQNEPEVDQRGTMPQCRLHPDFEIELAGRLLPERLKAAGLDTGLWINDHDYIFIRRIMYMLSDTDVLANVGAVAFHPYTGKPEMMRPLRKAFPDLPCHLTEKGPNYNPNSPESHISWWGTTILGALNNGCSSFTGWNYALDENGAPNLGNFHCAGLVEIHSQTREVKPSVQYYAFAHLAPYVRRGAELLTASVDTLMPEGVICSLFRNPDSSVCAVVNNASDITATLQFQYCGRYLKVLLPGQSLTTLFLNEK